MDRCCKPERYRLVPYCSGCRRQTKWSDGWIIPPATPTMQSGIPLTRPKFLHRDLSIVKQVRYKVRNGDAYKAVDVTVKQTNHDRGVRMVPTLFKSLSVSDKDYLCIIQAGVEFHRGLSPHGYFQFRTTK